MTQEFPLSAEATPRLSRPRRPARTLFGCSYVVPYCVPFWTRATYTALVKCVFMGRIIDGPDVGRLAGRIADLLGVPACVPCGSGRAGIALALKATGVGPNAEVVIPTFCCPSIITPVLAVGATPVLADIGSELNLTPETVDAALTSRTRAVIVPHLFGNPADVDAIAELCAPRRVVVIDDAAQALGATLRDRMVGTFGNAGILSFGNGKVCFGTGGGVLLSRDPELVRRARGMSPVPDRWTAALGRALSVLLWRRGRQWFLPLERLLTRIGYPPAPPTPVSKGAMRNLDAAIANTLLDTLPANLRARRKRARRYQEHLSQVIAVSLFPHGPGSACLTQVVRVKSPRCTAHDLTRVLRSWGFEVGRSYIPLHSVPAYQGFSRGRLDRADKLREHLVELPCEPSVRLAEVDQIADIVRRVLDPCTDAAPGVARVR